MFKTDFFFSYLGTPKRPVFILNKDSQVQVMIDGQFFDKHVQTREKVKWKCVKWDQHGCKAFVVTSCAKDRKLLHYNASHNHKLEPVIARTSPQESKEAHELMKQFRANLRSKLQSKRGKAETESRAKRSQ
uniref:FLYWCH-type domain-containing protein n=1 Tax=Anopheles coluzzii TaxID=1518534 RepID=A0A8W7PAE1_ANOCL